MNNRPTYDLLAAYLSGNCTQEESQAVESWANKNPDEYADILMSWNMAGEYSYPKVENSFDAIRAKISSTQEEEKGSRVVPFKFNSWMKVAASLVILAVVSIIGYNVILTGTGSDRLEITYQTPAGEKLQVELPDGSQVWLNAGSVLTLSKDFAHDNRTVSLSGEAFFDVEKNPEVPFEISAGLLKVRVKGTSFVVENYEQNHTASVSVRSGNVEVLTKKNTIELTADQGLILDKDKLTLVKKIKNISTDWSWLDGVLVFNKQPLREVVAELERQFNVDIVYDVTYSEMEFTGKFKSESIEEILEVLGTSLNVKLELNK